MTASQPEAARQEPIMISDVEYPVEGTDRVPGR
jgi:hypothetical protein